MNTVLSPPRSTRAVPAHVARFAEAYYPFATRSAEVTGVPWLVTLGQAAVESGWGRHAPGNNFFGIKAGRTEPAGTRQLLTTTEVLSRPDVTTFPEVISVTRRPDGKYLYTVRDWFRVYPTPADAFIAHGRVLRGNARYAAAWQYTGDPYQFIGAVARAGYATEPDYADVVSGAMRLIERARRERVPPASLHETFLEHMPARFAPQQELRVQAGGAPAPAAGGYWRGVLRFGLPGNAVEPLIDGPATFAAMQRAIESARTRDHYVYLLGWWCDPWVNLTGPALACSTCSSGRATWVCRSACSIWDAPALVFPNHSRLNDAAVMALNRLPNCHAQQDDPGVRKSQHQKLLVVKGTGGLVAIGGGVDVNADRVYALPPPPGAFRSDRPRQLGWGEGSGGSGSGPAGSGAPLHDVQVRVSGPSALPLLRMFIRRWWARSGSRAIDQRAPLRGQFTQPLPPPTGRQFVRVGETFNGVLRPPNGRPSRVRSVAVQDIWVRSILGARKFIYIEEQYMISTCAAAAIRSVLPRLQHVTILIPPSEITDLPGKWRRRREFIQAITDRNPHAAKLHIYTRALPPEPACRRSGASTSTSTPRWP